MRGAEDRLNNLGLRCYANGFETNGLGLMELGMRWGLLTVFVNGRWRRTKEGFQRSHDILDQLFTKLKTIKLPEDVVELEVCGFKSGQVIFAIDL